MHWKDWVAMPFSGGYSKLAKFNSRQSIYILICIIQSLGYQVKYLMVSVDISIKFPPLVKPFNPRRLETDESDCSCKGHYFFIAWEVKYALNFYRWYLSMRPPSIVYEVVIEAISRNISGKVWVSMREGCLFNPSLVTHCRYWCELVGVLGVFSVLT